MTNDTKQGMIHAYEDMRGYANSMVVTEEDPLPWLDMAFYAQAGIDDLDLELDLDELERMAEDIDE